MIVIIDQVLTICKTLCPLLLAKHYRVFIFHGLQLADGKPEAQSI